MMAVVVLLITGSAATPATEEKTEIKVLCIGNSYTQDAAAYAPFIVESLSDGVELTLGISFFPGASIDDYLEIFSEEKPVLQYYKHENGKKAWNVPEKNTTLQHILEDETWDIVTFQQASRKQGDWSSYSGLNELIERVVEYASSIHSKEPTPCWLMPALRLSAENMVTFKATVECVQKVLETTPVDFVIPCGTATQNARQTSLQQLGDSGGLTADTNGHLQEGLPRLLEGYVLAAGILELCGEETCELLGETTRPSDNWANGRRIPGRRGNAVGITEENCRLAQECALAALRGPFSVTV
ncbi:MAG: DUF4886 domain-containing protein, partial [Oscillospiraceae bacterium]|nr:DUF4886 domain-containing protein [Oscillospiraceae bacterium]